MNDIGLIVGVVFAVVLITVSIWQYRKNCR